MGKTSYIHYASQALECLSFFIFIQLSPMLVIPLLLPLLILVVVGFLFTL